MSLQAAVDTEAVNRVQAVATRVKEMVAMVLAVAAREQAAEATELAVGATVQEEVGMAQAAVEAV